MRTLKSVPCVIHTEVHCIEKHYLHLLSSELRNNKFLQYYGTSAPKLDYYRAFNNPIAKWNNFLFTTKSNTVYKLKEIILDDSQ